MIDPQSIVVSYLGHRHSGSFPLVVQQMKYLVVAIEYFTKWIETEPVAQLCEIIYVEKHSMSFWSPETFGVR